MNKEKRPLLIDRWLSVGHAWRGAMRLINTESSIKIQLAIALLVTVCGFYFRISYLEWIVQILAIIGVLGMEGMNTAIEKLSDYVQPEFDRKIGIIKDISAGAVLMVSIGAVIIGLIIYLPKILSW